MLLWSWCFNFLRNIISALLHLTGAQGHLRILLSKAPTAYRIKKPLPCILFHWWEKYLKFWRSKRFKLLPSHAFSAFFNAFFQLFQMSAWFSTQEMQAAVTGSSGTRFYDKTREWQPWAIHVQTAAKQRIKARHLTDMYPCSSCGI